MTMRDLIAARIYRVLAPNAAVPFQDQGELTKQQCYDATDAALDELLEPTEGMEAAILGTPMQDANGINCFQPPPCQYRAAIRAAKEGK